MAARDHFRAHARRRVDLAATLRIHEGPARAEPLPALEAPARGPRLTLEWTSGADPAPPEGPAKPEVRSASEGASPAGREGGPPQGVRIRDLGLGGAGIEIPEAAERAPTRPPSIEREAKVTIELVAPMLWDPLILSGRIAWIRRGGPGRGLRAGVRFEHSEPPALYALFRLLGTYVQDA
jgi:hypothetical protein